MNDTIAALSTAPVRSAIGILRLSGPDALAIALRVFRPRAKKILPRTAHFGTMWAGGVQLDEGLLLYMPGPGSYTGEDVAELNCHGSPGALEALLGALYDAGARPALPGEFTRRAFLSGKLDLTQAEAVIDLIDSRTAQAARNAAAQLDGVLGRRIASVRAPLVELAAHFSAVIDYPDEDVPEFLLPQAEAVLSDACETLTALRDSFDRGAGLQTGVPVAILGRPNVGKSSLLNALSGRDRSIVTDVAGTTRDIVEQTVRIAGVPVLLQDTAGLHETADTVEAIGVERAKACARDAAFCVAVFDASAGFSDEDRKVLDAAGPGCAAVVNKCDIAAPEGFPEGALFVSAKSGAGLDALRDRIAEGLRLSSIVPDGSTVTNPRQASALARARDAFARGLGALRAGMTPDVVMLDVEEGIGILDEITGRSARSDILDAVFSRFCVGK